MADGMSGRHRQNALGDADIQVTAGHHQRTHKRLPAVGNLRVSGFPPCVSPSLLEHQLLHRAPFFSSRSSILERPF